jgi:Xaa-Pro dipeptidase
MAESALVAGARASHPGNTDSDVAAEVAAELARQGSEFTGSPPYVVGGAASASSHAIHARRPLQPHEPMWLEISASVERYQGVTSRIAGTDALSAEARRHFDISASAIRAMLGAMRPGVTAGAVDAAGRAAVDRHGLGHLWKNRAAYSLGLSFPPGLGEGHIIDLKPGDIRLLKANMVFHLIPILKVPGVGAIGCTETVMVSEDGGVRLGSLDMVPLTPETLK